MQLLISMILLFFTSLPSAWMSPEPKFQQTNTPLLETVWVPVELMGEKVLVSPDQNPAYLKFNQLGNQVNASVGCNTISGSFALLRGQRIQFSQLISTMKACSENMIAKEILLKRTLETANRYTIRGDTLSLSQGRRAPMAKFVAGSGL